MVVEIDGKIHDDQEEYDALRTVIISQLGMNVVRIKNEELSNVKKAIDIIKPFLE